MPKPGIADRRALLPTLGHHFCRVLTAPVKAIRNGSGEQAAGPPAKLPAAFGGGLRRRLRVWPKSPDQKRFRGRVDRLGRLWGDGRRGGIIPPLFCVTTILNAPPYYGPAPPLKSAGSIPCFRIIL